MKHERVKCASLKPDPKNARKHSKKNLDAIKKSLERFGQQRPIVVDAKGIVIAGNGTLEAALALGWEEIDIVRSELKGSSATAYAVADNRTAELAEWDDDILAETLEALKVEDESLALATGFGVGDMEKLFRLQHGLCDEDAIPEASEGVTKSGDVWALGAHRVMCGDSTKIEDVNKLARGELASLVVTDPPYGVCYADKNAWLNKTGRGGRIETKMANDHLGAEDMEAFWRASFCCMETVMDRGAAVYCFTPQGALQMGLMTAMVAGAGITPRQGLVWKKNRLVLGRTDYLYQHEPIVYAWKKGGHKFYGDPQSSVLEFGSSLINDLHPTMKPVALFACLIKNSSQVGEVVYDPFLGSGTTLIAAEQLGRKCYGMEISPQYCDVIVKRWEEFTGKTATLESRE